MLQELVAIIFVILTINIFLILSIKSISRRFKDLMKKSTLNKLESYNDVIEEKENQLAKINEELLRLKSEVETLEVAKENNTSSPSVVTSIYSEKRIPEYEDEKFFNKYSFIRNNFKLNYKLIVQDFVFDNIEKNNELYSVCKNLLGKINLDTYYKLLKYDDETREDKLEQMLSIEEVKILKEYKAVNGSFDLAEFHNYIQEKITSLDPTILIKGNESFKYLEKIDKRIKVECDHSIIEGIKILYRGKIFDYSL